MTYPPALPSASLSSQAPLTPLPALPSPSAISIGARNRGTRVQWESGTRSNKSMLLGALAVLSNAAMHVALPGRYIAHIQESRTRKLGLVEGRMNIKEMQFYDDSESIR